jgi:hypothetical protein
MTLTDQQALDLGRRAVACARWEWRPGMLAWYSPRGSQGRRWDLEAGVAIMVRVLRVGATDESSAVLWCTADGEPLPRGGEIADCLGDDLVPVIRDHATLGALLGLVREAHGDPLLYIEPDDGEWFGQPGILWCYMKHREGSTFISGPFASSEAEALVAALEAAP